MYFFISNKRTFVTLTFYYIIKKNSPEMKEHPPYKHYTYIVEIES